MNTTICIASGPSLTQDDVDYCRDKGQVYVVNDCFKLAPWANLLYACDAEWWKRYKGAPLFTGQKFTLNPEAAKLWNLQCLKINKDQVWSTIQGYVSTGGNSGYQAVNLAHLHGAQRIILLGYDMKMGPDNKRHWFGNHPGAMNKISNYKKWIENFEKALPYIKAAGLEIINCTRDTELNCFKKANLKDVI